MKIIVLSDIHFGHAPDRERERDPYRAVAEVIGAKLAAVSSRHQVLCVTHLPQIAAHATGHFIVRKRVQDGRTVSEIVRLDEQERVEEMARMAGGRTVSDKARVHARELLASARKTKRQL